MSKPMLRLACCCSAWWSCAGRKGNLQLVVTICKGDLRDAVEPPSANWKLSSLGSSLTDNSRVFGTAMAPFVLSRAVPHDMKEIVELQYDSFEDDLVHELFMGCNSRHDLPKLVARYTEAMMQDPSDIWIMIKDAATGRTVAASNWKLYLGSTHMQHVASTRSCPGCKARLHWPQSLCCSR